MDHHHQTEEKSEIPHHRINYPTRIPNEDPPPSTIRITKKLQLGDLVMSTAGRIQHPCFLSGVIDDSYILFGIVRSFTYMNWSNKKNWNNSYNEGRVNIEWTTFNSGERRYIEIKNNKPLTIEVEPDDLIDTMVKSPDVAAEDVTLLAKRNNSDLTHLNHFLRSEVDHQCFFAIPEGWSGYY